MRASSYIAFMRVLIVGCGYVGLCLGRELAGQGHEVYGLRRSPAGEAELLPAGIKPLYGDVSQPADLARLPGAFDWVVNTVAAGQGGVDDYRRTYLEGTAHLIAWLQTQPPQKFIYTSSTGVYGQDDGSGVDEQSATAPASDTSQVLVQTELRLLEAAQSGRFPAVILRVAGIYGPNRGYWLRQFLQPNARLRRPGDRFMNMIHRDDLAAILVAALQQGRPGEIYNAVDDEPVRQLVFFQWLAAALNRPLPPFAPPTDRPEFNRAATNKKVLNHKLKTEFGYRFRYPTFREGYRAEIQRLGTAGMPGPSGEPVRGMPAGKGGRAD